MICKPKELDWSNIMKKSVSRTVKLTNILHSLKTTEDLDNLLTQQRTELTTKILEKMSLLKYQRTWKQNVWTELRQFIRLLNEEK